MPNTNKQYNNPPLRETYVELKTVFETKPDTLRLLSAHNEIKERYPQKKVINVAEGKLDLGDEGISLSNKASSTIGYQFWSKDQKRVAQFRNDGFAFNQLKPYVSWDQFYGEAALLWRHFVKTQGPSRVSQVNLRSINAIEVPQESFEITDYLNGVPPIPAALPQVISHYLNQIELEFEEPGLRALITQNIPKQPPGPTITVILDIDVAWKIMFKAPSLVTFDECLSKVREEKNRIFESYITDKARELFK